MTTQVSDSVHYSSKWDTVEWPGSAVAMLAGRVMLRLDHREVIAVDGNSPPWV